MKRIGLAMIITVAALLGLVAYAYAQAGASVVVSPATQSVEMGQPAQVAIRINNVTGLYGAEVHIHFDPTVLKVASVTSGDLLDPAHSSVISNHDNTAGTIDYAVTLLAPAPAVSGSGTLFTVRFDTLKDGTSAVDITNAILVNAEGAQISATVSDGQVSVTLPPEIPEAGTLALLASGLAGLAVFARRKWGK
ncbi:MAG: PEP-CTERM sorting domain-containing protein [Anaerolineae bacterium]|nr:PEP-CTERM sorting domain-containing protein [Anaerolineae bacterium]